MVAAINNDNRVVILAVPQDQVIYQQGVNLYHAGNYGPAWAAFNEAIRINPNEQVYYYMRAASSSALGLYNAALADYNTALRLCKNNDERGWNHFDLAILYNLMGDEQNALSHLVTAARLGNGMARNVCNQAGIPY